MQNANLLMEYKGSPTKISYLYSTLSSMKYFLIESHI